MLVFGLSMSRRLIRRVNATFNVADSMPVSHPRGIGAQQYSWAGVSCKRRVSVYRIYGLAGVSVQVYTFLSRRDGKKKHNRQGHGHVPTTVHIFVVGLCLEKGEQYETGDGQQKAWQEVC